MRRILTMLFAVAMGAGVLSAGEKKLMHCFTFTAIESATQDDWNAFYKATDQLSSKIPGLSKVWYGKLANPRGRTNGVCMEFKDEAALKSYADNAAHKEWQKSYEKVRQPGTTTFDLIGQ